MTITLQAVNELIASLESAGELSIREQKFLKLAKAYVQLAAENMSMIRLLTDISDNHVEYFSEGEMLVIACYTDEGCWAIGVGQVNEETEKSGLKALSIFQPHQGR